MLFPPDPNYEYDVTKLVRYYEKAIDHILRELERVDLTQFDRANNAAVLKAIAEIIRQLNGDTNDWTKLYIEKAALDGVERALLALGIAEASSLVKLNPINKEFVKAAVADTQADLLAVTQNVDKKVRAAVRQVTAQVMRNNLPQGINATATLRREVVAGLKKTLGESVNTGIIDAAGRRWKPTTYANVLVQTKMMEAHKEATINEALSREVYYGVISRHNAIDACSYWEGKIIKLTPDAPGNFPYVGDLPRNEIFHPYCRHTISPVRRPESLPESIKEINGLS